MQHPAKVYWGKIQREFESPRLRMDNQGDTFQSISIFTDTKRRGMEIWFCKLGGFDGVITEIEQKVFIPDNMLKAVSQAALNVLKDLNFGHVGFKGSDFGWWSCTACGSSGTDMDDPKESPCVQVDTNEK